MLVESGGKLKSTLKDAMLLLQESDRVFLRFEFDGVEFTIFREFEYEDAYSMISNVLKARQLAQQRLAEKANSKTPLV